MGKLNRKFKKLITSDKRKVRDVGIMVSQYLNDVHDMQVSPKELWQDMDEDLFMRNWYLAKAYYSQLFSISPAPNKPKNPKDGQYWINEDYSVEQYHLLTGTWISITEPKLNNHEQHTSQMSN